MKVDELGYDSLWTWDHLYAIFGDPYQPIFEGYTTLAAWAKVTSRVRLGLLVGANTFRNPGLVAKTMTTIDHLSGGRAICGIGGAWFEQEHTEHGIDFGTGFGQRLDWLDESVAALRALFDGEAVTSAPDGRYQFAGLRLLPPPVQEHLPIMIGGSGEKKTLRTVAKLRRPVERDGQRREAAPQGRGATAALRGGRARPGRDHLDRRMQADHPRHGGRGAPGVGGADVPQPDAHGGRRGRRHLLGRDRRSRSRPR